MIPDTGHEDDAVAPWVYLMQQPDGNHWVTPPDVQVAHIPQPDQSDSSSSGQEKTQKKKVSFAEKDEKLSRDFSSPDADLIVRSSDGVSFHVFSQILIEASAVFHDMIVLGSAHAHAVKEALAEGGSSNLKDQIPIVDVSEDANIVDSLLRLVYPIRNPSLIYSATSETVDETLDNLVQLLKASDKYQMEGILWTLREALVHPELLKVAPVRVYTIACMFGLEDEAKLASKYSLSFDVLRIPIFGELSHISARDYIRLVQLHQTRATSALTILQSATPTCLGCSKEREAGPLWWTEFKDRASIELRQKPNSDVIFNAGFIARCVMESRNACAHCPLSYLSVATQARLVHMKERIDGLPATVDTLT